MKQFIQKHQENVNGTLSGFDRLVFRGNFRWLSTPEGMMSFLSYRNILLKDFSDYVAWTTNTLKSASLQMYQRANRPIVYLPSSRTDKEKTAQQIALRDNITHGLICVLTCVEPCLSFEVYKNRERKKLELVPRMRKCLHLYHYWIDNRFGFMNARIQTWFPFKIQVCINGREWLCRRLDERGLKYTRRDNCLTAIEHIDKAQRLMRGMLRYRWSTLLNEIAHRLNPAHRKIFGDYHIVYYWSAYQSEWATDIMFTSIAALEKMYPPLVRDAISCFSSPDVMRFLGKRLYRNFSGEIVSDYLKRPEGIRVKHSINGNSVKMYNKQGSILRIETTINNPHDFKVYRPAEGGSSKTLAWRIMRKGIADLHRRAEVSHAANERYLDALSTIDTSASIQDIVKPVCQPTDWKKYRIRGLKPWEAGDFALVKAVNRGEFILNGFRNRDIVSCLYPKEYDCEENRLKISRKVTRLIRMLRAHGIIRKVNGTHRYMVSENGRRIIIAILKSQIISLEMLLKIAA